MARIIAICNQKGGVGKTTTAVNLGAYLALAGRRVLLVDFDPQANASSALGYHQTKGGPASAPAPARQGKSIYHGIIGEATHGEIILPSAIYNYHFIPAAPHLAGALVELVGVPEREYFLRKFLNRVRHEYDYILIDLPPSLSLLAINGLMAADEVIIPVQAEYYSLEGLGQLLETIELIKNNLNHPIAVSGALITMYNNREHLSREVAKNLREHFPHRVFLAQVPRSVALAEAPSYAKPVLLYRPDSSGADAYRRLAEEVMADEATNVVPEGATASENFGDFNIIS
jgi:chromosome partitioning protein